MNKQVTGYFPELDFDRLSLLASTNPAAFENLRTTLIKSTIQSSGNNSELLQTLQRRIESQADTEIPRHLSCLIISAWLDETYRQLNRQIDFSRSQSAVG
ncbi:MAG: DUF3135 domain-containing protein [Bacteroidota bacterium]